MTKNSANSPSKNPGKGSKGSIFHIVLPIVTAILGGLIGAFGPPMIEKLWQPRVEIIAPKNYHDVTVPFELQVQFSNRPKDRFVCAFLRGARERIYYPLTTDFRTVESDGECTFLVETMGGPQDNGAAFELVTCLVDDRTYCEIESVVLEEITQIYRFLPEGAEEKARIRVFRTAKEDQR